MFNYIFLEKAAGLKQEGPFSQKLGCVARKGKAPGDYALLRAARFTTPNQPLSERGTCLSAGQITPPYHSSNTSSEMNHSYTALIVRLRL